MITLPPDQVTVRAVLKTSVYEVEPDPATAHRVDKLTGGVHCHGCDKVIEKIHLRNGRSAPVVLFRRCKECKTYNVVDCENLLVK